MKRTAAIAFLATLTTWFVAAVSPAAAQEAVQAIAPPNGDGAVLPEIVRWRGVFVSVFVVLFSWLAIRFADRLLATFGATFSHRRLFFQQVQSVFRFFVYIATMLIVVFLSFHMSTQALALLGGTVAVAVGFATKDIVASLVAGIVIIFDRPFRLGDRVAVEGYYGDIVQIGLRSVKLLTLDGNVITIPNSVFTNSVTSCGNYGVLNMKLFVDFYVDADSDVARAVAIVREAAAVSPFTYLSEPIHVGVSEQIVGNRVGVRIRLAAFVIDTKHEKDFETDVSMRVLTAYREEGIKAPQVKRESASTTEVLEKSAEFAH